MAAQWSFGLWLSQAAGTECCKGAWGSCAESSGTLQRATERVPVQDFAVQECV